MTEPRGSRWLIAVPLFLLLALFAYNVDSGYFLSDDSFISFRYAQHLADGQGLVWNTADRVEGYTNFLWVLLMAAAIELGARPEIASNVIGIAAGAVIIVTLLFAATRTSDWRDPLVWVAPVTLVASRSFTAWCTGGLETMFFSLLVFLAYLRFLSERDRDATVPIGSSLLFAAATLTRPDGALFAGVAGLFFLAEIVRGRRRWIHGLAWIGPYALVVGLHLLWRLHYYGFWLPNSFYAKVPGAWWDQGLRYLGLFVTDYGIVWFVPLIAVALLLRRSLATYLCAVSLLVHVAYVAFVGGDRFEFRFLVVVMPGLYWLVAEGLRGLVQIRSRLRAAALLLGLALPIATAAGARSAEAQGVRHGVAGLGTIRDYAARRADEGHFLRGLIDAGKLPPDLIVCVGGAGALPYYTAWPTVDRRGINDVRIAHAPLLRRGVVAHERDVPYAYLLERDVVIFDVFNRIVHDRDFTRGRRSFRHDGVDLPLHVVRAGERFLIFASPANDDKVKQILSGLKAVP